MIKRKKFKIYKKPLVCMVCGSPLPPEYSGSSIQALVQANYLIKHSVDIFFLSPTFNKENVRRKKIGEIDSIRIHTKKNFLGKLFFMIKLFYVLVKNNRKYNIIHIHGGGYVAYPALIVGYLFSRKIIFKMTTYTDEPKQFINSNFGWLKYFLIFKLADVYIAISNLFKNRYIENKLDPKKLILIPDIVDVNRFKPIPGEIKNLLRKKLKLPMNSFLAICVAKIEKIKGIDLLLDIWKKVIKSIDNAVLILVGPFDIHELNYVEMIKEKITDFSLKNNVFLLGFKSNIEEYLNASDIFLFTSEKEALPNAILQAMSCSLPCVSYELLGISEVIFDNLINGIVIKRYNQKEFIDSIIRICKDNQFANFLGRNARKKIENNFSEEIIGGEYIQLYNNLLEKN